MTPSRIIATWFGCGLSPIAPGTAGSAASAICVFLLGMCCGWTGVLLFVGVTAIAGFVVSGPAADLAGTRDPGFIVIDEVAGMAVTALPAWRDWPWLIAAFFLFRILDIWKPWPIRSFEKLPGGSGIMLDDLAAGIIGAALIQAFRLFTGL